MLVLSRRTQEELVIDDRIRIVVLGIQGQRVRLGIEAPSDVVIRRAEIEVDLASLHLTDSQSFRNDSALAVA